MLFLWLTLHILQKIFARDHNQKHHNDMVEYLKSWLMDKLILNWLVAGLPRLSIFVLFGLITESENACKYEQADFSTGNVTLGTR